MSYQLPRPCVLCGLPMRFVGRTSGCPDAGVQAADIYRCQLCDRLETVLLDGRENEMHGDRFRKPVNEPRE